MKLFSIERRKRIKIPLSIMILSLFLFVLPLVNIFYMGFSNSIFIKEFYKIPSRLSLLTNIVLFVPILVATMLIRGKKIGWYLFLIYSILLIFQNIYSLVFVPGLLNSGVLFRTVIWISLVIYFCKKDISAPYFKMYPRGWRGELRHPVSVGMNLNNKQMVTKDLSTTGFYVESNEFYLGLNEKVALTFPFHNEVQFTAGVVRIDTAGVGFAFRNLTKENREVLNEIIKKSKLRVE